MSNKNKKNGYTLLEIIIAISLTVSPVLELAKWMERRGWFGKLT